MLTNNDTVTSIELGSGSNQMNSYLSYKNNNNNRNNDDDDVNMIHQYKESETGHVESSELEPINNINYNKQQKLIRTSLWFANVSNLVLFLALLVGFIILIALGSATYYKVQHLDRSTVTTAYVSLGLPGNEGLSWNDVIEQSAGSTVNFWMWSGDDHINSWIDNIFAPSVLEKYDIKVLRHAINDTADAVDQMINDQKIVNNNNGGLVDLVWINGENFDKAMLNNVLYGPFATKLPTAVNFDFQSDEIKYDFGRLTSGYEMPYNMAQVVFIYNTKYFPNGPPTTIDELVTWIKGDGSGRFIYPQPECYATNPSSDDCSYDFTGSVFIRHFLYYYPSTSNYHDMLGDFNQQAYNNHAKEAFKQLRDIEPHLYRDSSSEKIIYPSSIDVTDDLFASESIYFTLSYDPSHAGLMVRNKIWPNTTMSYVLKSGTISNVNFVAIEKNAANSLAAGTYFLHSL